MPKACELYVWIKVAPKKAVAVPGLSTVIWNLGQQDAGEDRRIKRLGVVLSDSLDNPPSSLGDCAFYTYSVPIKDCTLQQAKDFNDPSFVAWKADAIALALHRITVAADDTPPTDPFCVTGP